MGVYEQRLGWLVIALSILFSDWQVNAQQNQTTPPPGPPSDGGAGSGIATGGAIAAVIAAMSFIFGVLVYKFPGRGDRRDAKKSNGMRLLAALQGGTEREIKDLIEKGSNRVDFGLLNEDGNSIYHLAAARGYLEELEQYRPMTVMPRNKADQTPFEYVLTKLDGQPGLIDTLLYIMSQPYFVSESRDSPQREVRPFVIHQIIKYVTNEEMLEEILDHGRLRLIEFLPAFSRFNREYQMPLHLALESNHYFLKLVLSKPNLLNRLALTNKVFEPARLFDPSTSLLAVAVCKDSVPFDLFINLFEKLFAKNLIWRTQLPSLVSTTAMSHQKITFLNQQLQSTPGPLTRGRLRAQGGGPVRRLMFDDSPPSMPPPQPPGGFLSDDDGSDNESDDDRHEITFI